MIAVSHVGSSWRALQLKNGADHPRRSWFAQIIRKSGQCCVSGRRPQRAV